MPNPLIQSLIQQIPIFLGDQVNRTAVPRCATVENVDEWFEGVKTVLSQLRRFVSLFLAIFGFFRLSDTIILWCLHTV